jgi:hypothetical protein
MIITQWVTDNLSWIQWVFSGCGIFALSLILKRVRKKRAGLIHQTVGKGAKAVANSGENSHISIQ